MPTQTNPSRSGANIKAGLTYFSEIQSINIAITSISNDKNTHTSDAIINPLLTGGKGVLLPQL